MASAEVAMKQVDVEGSKECYLQLIRDSLVKLSQNTHDLNRYDPKRIEHYSKVDPLVNLMNMIENPPDFSRAISCVLKKKTKETKEVIELPIKHPEAFESLGIAQPKEVESAGNDNIIPDMNEAPIPPVDSRKSKKKEAASASSISSAKEDISAYAQRRQRYLDGKRAKDQLVASLLAARLNGARFKNRQREMKFFYEPYDHITDPNHLEAVLADKREIGKKNGWKIYF